MPRLKQVPGRKRRRTSERYYDALFGDRDPVAEPGTATGTPGNWWTVFALVPYVFDHATSHFGMFGMFADKSVSQLDGKVRELAIMRAGYTQGEPVRLLPALQGGSPLRRDRRADRGHSRTGR